ncbi:molybdate ABC transporter substrate-binding protein [Ramlibacter sp.]|uniref:molybdate ABC transporter substrate-binding protein n=1 Tax=Ramlibacter sp. TaxID=1917967 RepID=UPI002D67D412|nr:molybdate ABC transporter substrate-binding protein [Ramlibacter sp.]HYD74696.1 molybdate ABC transporter substrate-binding protein [Ramlibacter sp.]
MPRILAATLLVLLATGPLAALAATVQVAAAANLAAPMKAIAAGFQAATGHRASVALGSTGKFYAQVRNGAPFEVLLAADDETPARLEQEGLGVRGSRFTYATGRLALWSAEADVVDAQLAVLRQPPAGKMAIADPRIAPYGAAALQVLAKMGVRDDWQPHLVQGENIGQAFQFVASGNARLGFVALSQVMSDGRIPRGSAWIVPPGMHAPLKQDALLLSPGANNPAARALLDYLRSDAARTVLRSYGYTF